MAVVRQLAGKSKKAITEILPSDGQAEESLSGLEYRDPTLKPFSNVRGLSACSEIHANK
jgi:hypothetical protein